MSNSQEHLIVRLGRELFTSPGREIVHLVDDASANAFLNDLEHNSHAYVLACCMDRQTKAERAWMIPFLVGSYLGNYSFDALAELSLEECKRVFNEYKLHRFNDTMAEVFFKAVRRIKEQYNGNASEIWSGCPSSAAIVYRFLQFDGVGIKIATMATNILARQFKIPMADYYSIDVSPDVHVKRVMYRAGLVDQEDADNTFIIYKARELCPEFPGIIDFSLWEIGRTWCHPAVPDCQQCKLSAGCKKIGIK